MVALDSKDPLNHELPSPEPVEEPVVVPLHWGETNWFARTFFFQVEKLVRTGFKRVLNPDDTYPSPLLRTGPLYDTFSAAWKREHLKPKPDIRLIVMSGRWHIFIFTGILYGTSQATQLAGPLLLQRIVTGLNCLAVAKSGVPIQCEPQASLYYYCIGLFLAPFIQSICDNQSTYLLLLMGTQCRNSLMAAIYRKCLRLSNSSLQSESTGKVVTLMSNDAQKMQDAMMMIHGLWASPCFIVAVLVLLWFQVGWATFVGLGVMLLMVPFTAKLAAAIGGLRREMLKWTEKRVGIMSELVNGIQMIKFYAWESSFASEALKARAGERSVLRRQAMIFALFGLLLFTGPVAVAVFCFGSYSLSGHIITTAHAYTALSLFNLLRFPMSFLPMLITMVINAVIGLRRIGKFLEHSEAEMPTTGADCVEPGVVRIVNGEFAWDETAEKPVLRDINVELKPGTLTMVVGSVGSGKSSILGALVGHMSTKSGTVSVGGSTSYVAQTAWIMNDTLQENVLLGSDLEPLRYAEALHVSQLGPDIEILPHGDRTEIGDRGITLSGGQKQRVSIARAVYSNADVVLLDDPLSAVDSHVGRALFEKCVRGTLRGHTVVLVTNALQYLPHADHIIWMMDGRIKAQGTYGELLAEGFNIAELAHTEDEEHEYDQDTAADKVVTKLPTASISPLMAAGNHDSVTSAVSKKADVDVATDKVALDLLKDAAGKATMRRSNTYRNLTGVEMREGGNVSWHVAKTYLGSGGGLGFLVLIVFLFALEQGCGVYNNLWVGVWFSDKYHKTTWFYLGFYGWLGIAYGMCTFTRSLTLLLFMVRASVSLHNQLLARVLRLPKSWWDTNPAGRVLNRFSRDTEIMDVTLPQSLIQFAGCVATIIATFVVISITTKWFAIAIPPFLVLYFIIQRYYIPTARELQRIESITRSPIYSKFSEALQGIATIRAYRKEAHFISVSDELMELNAYAYVTQKLAAGWLAQRLDLLGLFILTGAGALCVAGSISATAAGLTLVYALDLTRYLKQATTMGTKAESDFNSAERIVQYLEPETEAAVETSPEVSERMDPKWPAAGAISISKLTMRYRPNMPLVLKGVSFEVEAGSKVGLVGRTGSGKSSLFLALFRMVEAESGSICIDGVDISSLGLRHLRSKMSIIPQDPFMFSGDVRINLDPFLGHNDDALWEVLEAVGLKPVIAALPEKLGAPVVDNGGNFSLGQRQLFCMARAMLRQSRILVLDEATASVDLETDNLLQTAIRVAFAKNTLVTIAHRLNTIMDSDRVVVMDSGVVVECDEPDALLQKDNGIFTGMVAQTGKASSRHLHNLASSARVKRSNSVFKTVESFATGHTPPSDSPGPNSPAVTVSLPPHAKRTPPLSASSSFSDGSGSNDLLASPGVGGSHGGALPSPAPRVRHSVSAMLDVLTEGEESAERTRSKEVSEHAALAAARAGPVVSAGEGASGSSRGSSEIEAAPEDVILDSVVMPMPPRAP